MSIRLNVILIIAFTNLLIIIFSFFGGTWSVNDNIKDAQEADMRIVADMADLYISKEIEILYLLAESMAKDLYLFEEDKFGELLLERGYFPDEFIGVAVFDTLKGRILAMGDVPAPEDALETTHIRDALAHKKTLKTTYPTDDGVVFYLAVKEPVSKERILVLTLPGSFFHRMLLPFVIWKTGHIFMIDPEGTFVSNPREHWIHSRNNVALMTIENARWTSLWETIKLMAQGEEGIGYYTVIDEKTDKDVPRVCAYKPVSSSEDGWSLGTVAPLWESPFRNINTALMRVGTIGFILGIIAAIIASIFITKPFEKVKELQQEAERNSKYKSQFLANMSHEMRTPLTSVLGLTELTLRTVNLDEETHLNLVKVYRAGETLLGLINDILDISKIEADKFTLNNVEYDLPSLLNDSITQSLLYVGEKPVDLVLDITEDLPRRLYGDELRVKQIINNLLSNAFKFTEEGKVELYVRTESEGDTVWLVVRVTDTGVGIKSEDFEKLFTLYAHMEKESKHYDRTRRIEGTGLGLSICKRIAEMMEGSIAAESEYGKGSVFTARLRQRFVDESPIGTDVVESLKKFHYSIDKFLNSENTRLNLTYARVLVVDDNSANLDVAKGLMSLYGMKIDCVTSGWQAIDAIRDEKVKYNAIFMDHMMPEIDGIEATQMIREINTEYARTVPIIALTANAVIGNEDMFLNKGFQAFIAKPIDLNRLDAILRQWVRDKDEETLLTDKFIKIGDRSVYEQNKLSENIAGLNVAKGIAHFLKEEIFIDVLRSFAKNTKPLLDIIKEIDTTRIDEYAIVVHGIKGSCRGIYAEETANKAEALEMAAKDGDIDFVLANNNDFINTASRLVTAIENALAQCETTDKPTKDMPDKAQLERLLAACQSYDIDSIDTTMESIQEYTYSADDGLVVWLKERLEQGKYKDVIERLSGLC